MQKPEYIYNHQSQALDILSIGTATCRFKSILYLNNNIILPIATSIAVYDNITFNKVVQFQTNQSTIYSLINNTNFIYAIGHDGDICQLDIKTYQKVNYINHRIGSQCRWSSIEGETLMISAEHSKNKGTIQVLNATTLKQIKVYEGCYFYGCVQNSVYYLLKSKRFGKLSKNEKAALKYKDLKKYKNNKQFLFDLEIHSQQGLERVLPFETEPGDILVIAQSPKYIAYFYYDRRILIYDIEKCQIHIHRVDGNGVLQAACFQNDFELVFQNKIKEITILNLQTMEKIVQQYKQGLNTQVQAIYKQNEILITASEENVTIYKSTHVLHKEFGGLTKCGIDFYKNDYVVSGDFLGNITINQLDTGKVKSEYFIGSPIRSIACKDNIIYIGTMEGQLYKYQDDECYQFDQIEGSITCIRVKKDDLLISSTHGLVRLYKNEQPLFTFLAHPPKEKSELFGSLNIHADIWTCIFNPEQDIFATGSEDQCVKVFDYSQKQIVELTGHKLAVTCLDWKHSQNQLILYSCSDDRTIRLYDQSYNLIKVINTFFINEWFTLTYMSVFQNLLAIGCQNGYFFLYDQQQGDFIVAQKTHMGGIEGLVMNSKYIATCSSDDCVNVIKIN
ncbi:unnamed protein product [Paramecium sonneborni]|uniref:Uncharacterized protein n=1 Tax=Paramecium sonneborni TaxID=65129 RepID=A0A8S1PL77_9CILI|nr:unnamed protein product [Paramecium sonneborni]